MSLEDAQLLFEQARALVEGVDEALAQPTTPRFHDPLNKAMDILDDATAILDCGNEATEDANVLREKIDVMRRALIDEMVE